MRASLELRTIAGELRDIPRTGMIAAAKAVKTIAREEAARVTGGDGRMSEGTRRGIKLRAVDLDVRSGSREPGAVTIRIQGLPVGPWVWRDTGTDPHRIRRRKKGPKWKMTVPHPGSRGVGAWARVVERSELIVPKIFDDAVTKVVR